MDFQIHRQDNTESSITLIIVAHYTPEEAEALAEADAWHAPCIRSIYALLGAMRWTTPEVTIRAPTFQQLAEPGLMIKDFSPYNADRFQNSFHEKYGRRIQNALGVILQAYREAEHRRLEEERDNYMGRPQLSYQPTSRIPRR